MAIRPTLVTRKERTIIMNGENINYFRLALQILSVFTLLMRAPYLALAANPAGCSGCSLLAAPATDIFVVSSGCTVPFTVRIGNSDNTVCNQTNLTVLFACPGPTLGTFGPTNVVATGLNIPAGTTPFTLTGAGGVEIVIPCVITTAPGVTTVQALAFATNNPGGCQSGPLDSSSASGMTSVVVTHPCIQVTSVCLNATTDSGSALVTYSGSITNCGDIELANVMAFHNQFGTNMLVWSAPGLGIGAITNFTRSYTNTTQLCGPFTGVLTVTAQDAQTQITNCPASFVTNSVEATCMITCISVAKVLDSFELTCTTGAQRNYAVQYTDSLDPLDWKVLTNFLATGPITVVKDRNSLPERFYRLVAY